MRKTTFVLMATTAAALGCSDRKIEIAKQLIQSDPAGGPPVVFTITGCGAQDAALPVDRACMIDSTGKTYAEDGSLSVFPAAPPYGAYLLFQPGFVPRPEDLSTTGAAASVTAWAAPYNVLRSPCCSEQEEANRVPAQASLTVEGGVLVTIREAVPIGSQVVIAFNFGALFRSRIATGPRGVCDLPNASFCSFAASSGYVMRFYVGRIPGAEEPDGSGAGPVTPPDVAPTPPAAGACLLSYNTALASGDPCCFRQGGSNTCDLELRCNERSGASCCTIYGTENTTHGSRCCRYEGGGRVDGADECATLLGTGR